MKRPRGETEETVRRIVEIWAGGDHNTSLKCTIREASAKRSVYGIPKGFLKHMFLVALEAESAETIGRALDVDSTLEAAVKWLLVRPYPEERDPFEWSTKEKEEDTDENE